MEAPPLTFLTCVDTQKAAPPFGVLAGFAWSIKNECSYGRKRSCSKRSGTFPDPTQKERERETALSFFYSSKSQSVSNFHLQVRSEAHFENE